MSATRVGGGVEGAFGADLFGAGVEQRAAAAVGAGLFEAVAGQRVRVAGAALVEHEQVARVEDRPEQFGEVFGERHRRLPRPAGQRDHRGAALRRRARRRRRIASVIVPGVAPLGSSGTVRCAQAKIVAFLARAVRDRPGGGRARPRGGARRDARGASGAARTATASFLTDGRTSWNLSDRTARCADGVGEAVRGGSTFGRWVVGRPGQCAGGNWPGWCAGGATKAVGGRKRPGRALLGSSIGSRYGSFPPDREGPGGAGGDRPLQPRGAGGRRAAVLLRARSRSTR